MKTNKFEIKVTSQFKKDLKIIQKRKLNIIIKGGDAHKVIEEFRE